MTSNQNGGFGRRGAARPAPGVQPTTDTRPIALARSPLVKQIGGVVLGVAIAFGLGATFVALMKQAGRTLDRKFVENATPGSPQDAIKGIKTVDADLQAVQQTCTEQSKTATLNVAQTGATDGYMELYSGESELARGAAFVECLATTKPARFCQAPHKTHLVESVRQYAKLNVQMREAWFMATSGPGLQKAALMGTPYRLDQRVALAMPSAVTSPAMLAALRALAVDGYVTIKDFSGASGVGASLTEALKDVPARKAPCG
jgi:hypothetical protein